MPVCVHMTPLRCMRGITIVLLLSLSSFIGVGKAAERPNVLLIMTDDQGWGDVRCHGNEKIDTPTMDRLAASGACLDRFFVSPMCAPTRASLLTGRWNSPHRRIVGRPW